MPGVCINPYHHITPVFLFVTVIVHQLYRRLFLLETARDVVRSRLSQPIKSFEPDCQRGRVR